MKISEMTEEGVARYLRLGPGEYDEGELKPYMDAAAQYIADYTGLPLKGDPSIDSYDDLAMAYLVLCQDMYDNRTADAQSANANRTIATILDMHSRNLLSKGAL